MLQLVSIFGDNSSGLGALGVSGSAFIIQLITFVLAYLVLRKWAFGPILKILRERRETIDKGVQLGEQMQKKQAELEEQINKTLHEARVQADGIVAGAEDTARQVVHDAEDTARTKADNIIKEGQERGEQEVAHARKALEKELVGLVSEVTEAMIGEKVDAKKDAALIDKALKTRSAA